MQKLSAFKPLCVPKRETWCRKDGLVYPSLNFRNYMRYVTFKECEILVKQINFCKSCNQIPKSDGKHDTRITKALMVAD